MTGVQTCALPISHGWLASDLARRWASSYGTRAWQLLEDVHCLMDLGQNFGAGLYAREVDYLCEEEWAVTLEDILWRRSKLGLLLGPMQQQRLARYLQDKQPASASPIVHERLSPDHVTAQLLRRDAGPREKPAR